MNSAGPLCGTVELRDIFRQQWNYIRDLSLECGVENTQHSKALEAITFQITPLHDKLLYLSGDLSSFSLMPAGQTYCVNTNRPGSNPSAACTPTPHQSRVLGTQQTSRHPVSA
jgi:hypothetical protein